MFWGLREWLLAGRDGRKPARMKGLQSRTYCLHTSVIIDCGRRGRGANPYAPLHRPRRRATCPGVKPCIHAGSPKSQSSHLQQPARKHFYRNSLRVSVQYGAHSSPTHFFCLSVGFPKFVSGKSLASSAPDACRGPTKPV